MNLVGGCCGIIFEYIVVIVKVVEGVKLRVLLDLKVECCFLGLELFNIGFEILFVNVGECINVTGFVCFKCLIKEE